jgi:hypothetical protein
VDYKLMPSFWLGEFGRAWITPEGISQSWQQLVMTSSPYILDLVCIVVGVLVLRKTLTKNPFLLGLLFMLLCLRPAFDLVCESVAFLSGDKGDIYHIAGILGGFVTWSFLLLSIGLSLISILTILRRFAGFPETVCAD